MNRTIKKLLIIAILSATIIAGNLVAMQGLVANFYANHETQQKSKYSINLDWFKKKKLKYNNRSFRFKNIFKQDQLRAFFLYDQDVKDNIKEKLNYSVNLMWINDKLQENQQFIHPKNDEFVSTICKWAALNDNGVVNVWYDSEMTTADAVNNTDTAIKKASSDFEHIVLRNVRELSEVQNDKDVFTMQQPIYFRVDLLRAIAAYNDVSQNKVDYFVYSDLDGKPISEDQLFDEQTIQNLKQYGMVMAQIPSSSEKGAENGFQIISSYKPNLLKAKKTALIDANIKQAKQGLVWEQKIYYSYRPMFQYFYHLEGCGKLGTVGEGWKWEDYDENKHGLDLIHNHSFMSFDLYDDWCKSKYSPSLPFIPTKNVNLPPSHF